MAEKRDPRTQPAPGETSGSGMRRPTAPGSGAAKGPASPGSPPAEPSGSLNAPGPRRRTGDSSGVAVAPGESGKLRPRRADASASAMSKPQRKSTGAEISLRGTPRPTGRRWRRWLAVPIVSIALAAAAAGGAWYWQTHYAGGAPAVEPQTPVKPTAPAQTQPEVFLPPPADKTLPRAYHESALGAGEEQLGRQQKLAAPPSHDPWCDLAHVPPKDALVREIGFDFNDRRAVQISIRYRPEKAIDELAVVERATRLYGKPAGQYTFRTSAQHVVTFWEDGKTVLKLVSEVDGGEHRLVSLHLLDKDGSTKRAARGK